MKKFTCSILISILGVSIFLMAGCSTPDNPPKTEGTEENTETPIDQTNLLYLSSSWAGLCGKDGRDGGCYWKTYLYTTGKVLDISVFQEIGGKDEENRNEKQLTHAQVEAIIKEIKDSTIMEKACEPVVVMDAGWDYKIILDGKEKSFQNSPDDCKKIFDKLDKLILP